MPAPTIPGVQTFGGLGRNHVEGTVHYAQVPPVGGDHAPIWQSCGFYTMPIQTERGVHSMEHGAVWITYRPGLPAAQIAALQAFVGNPFVLVTPWPGLRAPVVLSAWGLQLAVDDAKDSRVAQFVGAYAHGPQTPEIGVQCLGGATDTPGT